MTSGDLRERYLTWTRRAIPVLLVPLALTAFVQIAAASEWWSTGPAPEAPVRFLFIAVAVASVVMGRSIRQRDTAVRPLAAPALAALSWRLVTLALIPSAIGAVLAFMTRSAGDYYLLLLVTLGGFVMLYPRYDQWVLWASPSDREVT